MTLDLFRHDLYTRSESWLNLPPEERRRRAVQACADKDEAALWTVVEAYLTQFGASGVQVSRHTLASYHTGLRQLVSHMQGHAWNVLSPDREAAQRWINHMLQGGLAIATVKVRAAAGATFYKALRWSGASGADPFRDVRFPKDRRHSLDKNAPYPPALISQVLDRAREHARHPEEKTARRAVEVWALLLVLTHTGLRIDEALSLRWPDLPKPGTPQHLTVQSGKGRKSRAVPVSARLLDALRAYRALPRSRRHKEDFIFPYRTWQGASYHVRPLFPQGEFRGFHAFRKYMGSRLYEALGDFVAVAEVLGHADVNTTRAYVRVGVGRAGSVIQDW